MLYLRSPFVRSSRDPPRSVVVTGASTGIGEACALHLASRGFRVFAGVRKQADGDALRAKSNDRLEPILLDVADAGSIASAERDLAARLHGGGLDGLVNNAGIGSIAPLEFVPIADVRKQVEVNLVGLIAVTQAMLPLLRRRRGRIVNMGSIQGRLACPFMGVYAATKFAIVGLSPRLGGLLVRPVELGAAERKRRASEIYPLCRFPALVLPLCRLSALLCGYPC